MAMSRFCERFLAGDLQFSAKRPFQMFAASAVHRYTVATALDRILNRVQDDTRGRQDDAELGSKEHPSNTLTCKPGQTRITFA